jgi:alpha-N-arabinofuranosidase
MKNQIIQIQMKPINRIRCAAFLLLIVSCIQGTGIISAQNLRDEEQKPVKAPDDLTASIDLTKSGEPIHRYVYGMFTELLGNIFEHGLWAEMLSDRKFFYPVDTSANLNPVNTRRFQNRWRPVGGDDIIAMDHIRPYTGAYSPFIKLSGSTEYGIQQSGLVLRDGRNYTGRVILSGDAGARIEVSLIWGPGKDERQVVQIHPLTEDYLKYPFIFTAGADTENGRLEITGTGTGSYRIGAVSLMPADNIHGFRSDLVALLRELNSGIYRWPGGNMLAGYDWRDGIGDIDRRPPRYDYAWNAVESNDVGTDEFIVLCRLLDIDPYICVNIGFGDAFSAAQWVEYVNGPENSPMGRKRALNGHPEPYHVEWWGIGNEMYGQWQLGHMSIEHYILKHNMFARAMLDVDPDIRLIASGATPFETSTTARHHRKPLPDMLPYQYGSREDWSYQLLAHASDNFHFLAEHLYPVTSHAFVADSQKFVDVDDPLVDQVRRVPNRVRAVAESWEEYINRIPGLKEKNITFAIDEWTGGGWRSPFMRTLCAAEGLHEIFRHSEIVTMGGYTAVTSCIRWDVNDACYSSVGLLFKLYRHHFGTLPLEVTGNSPQKPVKGTIGVDKPAVSSGSDTYPLDVMAALTGDRKMVTVAVVNPTETAQEIKLEFSEAKLRNHAKQYLIAGPDLKTDNNPGEKPAIEIRESETNKIPGKTEVMPLSITLFKLELK